jgi:hypothetical protein
MSEHILDSEAAATLLSEALKLAVSKLTPKRGKARHNNRCNPWFTHECKAALRERDAAISKHGDASSQAHTARVSYLKTIRKSKRAFEQRVLTETVASWSKDSRRFWQSYRGPRPSCSINDIEAWKTYFEKLFTDDTGNHTWEGGTFDTHIRHHSTMFPSPTPEQCARASSLNADITPSEVVEALRHMHAHKAAGVDGLPIELLIHAHGTEQRATHILAPRLANLFTQVMRGSYPEEWGTCAVVPVYKGKGSLNDMDSYRGIAVGTSTSKLFSTIITRRLNAWAENEGFRAAGQAGFRPDRGTPDNVFVLQHILERACSQGRRVHAAFIDFRKAYDSVNRHLLWTAIQGMGIHGAMLDTLQRMHGNITMQVRQGDRLSQPFPAHMGVKQGDPLSPLLFGLFIDRCEHFLNTQCPEIGVHVSPDLLVRVLLYADDLVLLSYDAGGLQALLNALHTFCRANHLTVNTKKSVTVTFGGDDPQAVMYDGVPLPMQDQFTYLGIPFSSLTTRNPLEDMTHGHYTKGAASMHALLQRCREMGIHNVRLRYKLFQSLVVPVLSYGCEVWSVYSLARISTQAYAWGMGTGRKAVAKGEAVHKTFLRDTLQVPRSTSIAMMMSEVGTSPLMHAWARQMLGWWNRMVARRDGDIVKESLRESMQIALHGGQPATCWAAALRKFLRVIGFNHTSLSPVCSSAIDALHERWQSHAWAPAIPSQGLVRNSVTSTGFKRVVYRQWFCNEIPENGVGWVRHLNTRKQIRAMAMFRLGAHELGINSMRFGNGKRERDQRVCKCCTDGVMDDEYHVFDCPAFQTLREQHPLVCAPPPYNSTTNPDGHMRKCMDLEEDEQRWRALADFLIRHSKARRSLLAVPCA